MVPGPPTAPASSSFNCASFSFGDWSDNIKTPGEEIINGKPELVDQIYVLNIDSVNTPNLSDGTPDLQSYGPREYVVSGYDRTNTYTNQIITEFNLYFNDSLKVTLSQNVINKFGKVRYYLTDNNGVAFSIGEAIQMEKNGVMSDNYNTYCYNTGNYNEGEDIVYWIDVVNKNAFTKFPEDVAYVVGVSSGARWKYKT